MGVGLLSRGVRCWQPVFSLSFGILLLVLLVPFSAFEYVPACCGVASEVQIQVGEHTVTLVPQLASPTELFEQYPVAEGHPVIETFVDGFTPIWVVEDPYYNDSLAVARDRAILVGAMNQSGFWQLAFDTNAEATAIQWTCTVSDHLLPLNASQILLLAVNELRSQFAEGPLRLVGCFLSANPVMYETLAYYWHVAFDMSDYQWFFQGPAGLVRVLQFRLSFMTNGSLISWGYSGPGVGPLYWWSSTALFPYLGVGLLLLCCYVLYRVKRRQELEQKADKSGA